MAHKKCLKKVTWCDCIKDDIEDLRKLNNWEEEFETDSYLDIYEGKFNICGMQNLENLIEKYFKMRWKDNYNIRIKIKARKGTILIERVD